MKYTVKFVVLVATLLFVGCGSQVIRLQVERAPEIIITDAKTVKVNRFASSSNVELDAFGLSDVHVADLETALFDNGTYEVVKDASADITLSGSLNYRSTDKYDKTSSTDSEGKKVYHTSVKRSGVLRVQVVVTDRAGKMVGRSKFSLSASSPNTSSMVSYGSPSLQSRYDMFSDLLAQSVPKIMQRITPYTQTVARSLARVKGNDQISEANELAEKGLWEQAVNAWKAAEVGGVEARAASFYNQSIYFEKVGDLNQAKDFAEKSVALNANPNYQKRLGLLSGLILEKETVEDNFN